MALALNWGLHGILCVQVCWYYSISRFAHNLFASVPDTYYLAFPKDRLQAKLQVYGVLIFECFQSAIVAHDILVAFTSFGPGHAFDSEHALNSLHTTWFTIPVAGGISEHKLLSHDGLSY